MSRLEFFARPLVAFDPNNEEHRAIYNGFKKKPGWGHSPYRFICPDVQGMNLVSMIQKKMLDYYIDQEFGKPVAVKTSRKKVQNIKKLVDKKKV